MNTIKQLRQHNSRLEVLNYHPEADCVETGREIIEGLTQPQKRLPSKYFYDAYGSWLFERICDLPEYYLTRTELTILAAAAPQIMSFFQESPGDLVELGSGSHHKIKILLDAADGASLGRIRYVPVDISPSALYGAAQELQYTHANLSILGIIADFTRHLEFLPSERKLITFLGSTIGNFTGSERAAFLRNIAGVMHPEDSLVLGLDMLKPLEVIEAAYNDLQGVTAQFNKNILRNLNRTFHADFQIADFEHRAIFVPDQEQLEMHLQATCDTTARIADLGLSVACRCSETIHTEICKKFSRKQARWDFQTAGLVPAQWFTDPQGWFSLVVLKKLDGNNCDDSQGLENL
jgi:L-histidine Nalpha-methyltransferase